MGFTRTRIMAFLTLEVGLLWFSGLASGLLLASSVLGSAGEDARSILGDLEVSVDTIVEGTLLAAFTLVLVVGIPCRRIGRTTVAAALSRR